MPLRPNRPPKHPFAVDARVHVLRTAFRTVGRVAPGLSARVAEKFFCEPPAARERPGEAEFLARGERFQVRSRGHVLAAWRWGTGPRVYLAHGWGSRAGRFAKLGPALLEAGFGVVTWDAPAHGASSGRKSSMPEFAAALADVVREAGPAAGYVGHSLGGAAIAFALARGLAPAPAVIVAAPADPSQFADRFAELLALPPRTRSTLQRNLELRLDVTWDRLHVPTLARGLASPALVVHDRGDEDVPFTDGTAIAEAWPGAEFVGTEGLGHRAIVGDALVIRHAVEFLARHARGGAAA